jgi:hypothetical protein
MNEVSLKSLSSRLQRVERENRWMKVGVFTVLSILVFLGAKGQDIPDVIHAKKIMVSSVLGKAELNPAGLFIYGADKGKSPNSYYGSGSLEIRSIDGNHTLIYLGEKLLGTSGVPSLRMFSPDGNSMASLVMNNKGESSLRFNTNGKERVVLGGTELKDDKTGSTIIRPPTSLVFINEKGKVIWSAP